jgi:hypothetical protein
MGIDATEGLTEGDINKRAKGTGNDTKEAGGTESVDGIIVKPRDKKEETPPDTTEK